MIDTSRSAIIRGESAKLSHCNKGNLPWCEQLPLQIQLRRRVRWYHPRPPLDELDAHLVLSRLISVCIAERYPQRLLLSLLAISNGHQLHARKPLVLQLDLEVPD